jgi:ATP-dependent RNA helicase DDX46/PRP5
MANTYKADAGAFHATLEINDFGQRARWQATNRSNITKLLDKGHCSITNKGNFYTKGTQPGPNDPPKLYILVEGESEAIVSEVMKDLIELLKKGEIEEQQARAPTATARYNPLGK